MSAFSHPRGSADEDPTFGNPEEGGGFQPTWSFPAAISPVDQEDALPYGYTIQYDDDADAGPYSAEPPQPSFLDNILNPIHTMTAQQPARFSNGYVDLTSDSPEVTTDAARKTRRESATPGPAAKRQRRNDGTAAAAEASQDATVEQIDLSDDRPVEEVLQKQREDAVKAQATPDDGEKPTSFNTFNCVICMDTPTDLTATACGMSAITP